MREFALGIIITLLISAIPASAETIYTWTDKDGIKRFSNEPPPEGIEAHRIEAVPTPDKVDDRAQKRRSSFDRMVEDAAAESRELEKQRKEAEAARAAELQRQAELERRRQIDAQRRQLEERINAVRKRALSPTYTKGMQEAQIEAIRKQINELSGQPEPATEPEQESRKNSY